MKETIDNLKLVYNNYGKDNKKALIKIFIYSFFGIFTNIVIPLLAARFIVSFTDSKFGQAIFVLIIITIIYFLESFKILMIRKNNQIFKRGTVRNIQISLGQEILKLKQSELDSNSSGTFIQRLTGDTEKMSVIFTGGVVTCVKFLSAIGSFVAILIVDYHMFVFYLIASIILTFLNYVKNERVGEKDKIYRKQSDKVAGLTSELVRGAKDIKVLYAKDSFMEKLSDEINIQSENNYDMRNVDMDFNLLISFIKNILEFIGVLFIVLLIKSNVFSIAIGLVLYNYRTTVLTNFMDIVSELLETCKNFNISCERVFAIIDKSKYEKEKFGNKHLNSVIGNFNLKGVYFSYDGKKNILKNLNMKIDANKTYGIVGKSGSGKTTIYNLICKLYDYDKGSITIDGVELKNLDEESIRGNVTVISQNPYIFNLSIRDNLRLVKNDVTDKEIKEACKLACLTDLIKKLPDKYDTVLGEGGVNLSGGERQRLAIARALIQKTKIILFDEATSALDNETQNNIQKAIDNLKDDYTIIIIAHRLSTILNCDKIFYMNNGKIESSGTHKELLEKSSSYKDLYEYEIKNID